MSEPITYARAGKRDTPGVPRDWFRLQIIDRETGEAYQRVIEANAAEGWFIRYRTQPNGQLLHDGRGSVLTERVERPIEIRRKPGEPNAVRPEAQP